MQGIVITEAYEVEGNAAEAQGRLFRYFGVATCMKSFFWFWGSILWTKRFYATKDGSCYNFIDGEHMPNTTEQFRLYLGQNLKAQDEERYIKLLECAKKI